MLISSELLSILVRKGQHFGTSTENSNMLKILIWRYKALKYQAYLLKMISILTKNTKHIFSLKNTEHNHSELQGILTPKLKIVNDKNFCCIQRL